MLTTAGGAEGEVGLLPLPHAPVNSEVARTSNWSPSAHPVQLSLLRSWPGARENILVGHTTMESEATLAIRAASQTCTG